ncbi:hypothetical protein [Microbacterium sp. WCS2018Hpa-9]|nr:hypothetical protein [Microbacterium sp. WCS2018Hpa-9]
MARLRHIKSGAIVQVADEKVERLGSEWEPVEDDSQKARKPRSKK